MHAHLGPRVRTMALVCVAAAAATGCGRTVNRAAERRIRDALSTYVGPAVSWRAHVEGAPERTVRGRLGRVTIDGTEVRLREQITLDSLHIVMDGVDFDSGHQRLRSVQSTTFEAAIGEQSLNDFLHREPPPPGEPLTVRRVRLLDGMLRIEAARWLLGKDWPFVVTVTPRLAGANRLDFDPERMSVVGLRIPLPPQVLRFLARRLNAGCDLSALPFPLAIQHVEAARGRLSLRGTADLQRAVDEMVAQPGAGRGDPDPA
jgi:hypothetical protein